MAKKQKDLISFPMHLPHEVERLFDEMIHRPWGLCREIRGWNPSVDLYETEEAFVLEADLPGPEDTAEANQLEARLKDAIRRLPPEQAQVLRLSYYEDCAHGRIADQLGIPLGTVKSRVRMAVAQLRRLMEP